MGDKRTTIFPALLFAVFFFLITITGYFQIRVIQKGIEGLLKSEGEILFQHLKREIDINLEYLNLLEKSPSLITPNFLNIMVYDEAIVEDLYNLLHNITNIESEKLPLTNLMVIDKQGNTVMKKGTIQVPSSQMKKLLLNKQETLIKMPDDKKDKSLLMGIRVKDHVIFFSLDDNELEMLRKKTIIKEILDREGKRFNISGIKIYDAQGIPYLVLNGGQEDVIALTKPLDSKFLPNYTMEILVSRGIAQNIMKRTTFSFILILAFLIVSGALSIYVILLFERRYEKKMKEIEKELALKERLVSLGKLASGMAHEIRNPLNAISMSVQRLKREFIPENNKKEEYYRFIDIMRNELIRVDKIVEEFLLSTKANVPFVFENLYNTVEEVVTILKEKADSKGIRIINTVDVSMRIQCQKERLKQAFYNVILNGIEAIDKNGAIEVSAEQRTGNINIYIKDSGTGIKKEEIHNIFEYYYTTKDKGIGLGLPISYMIIKDHDGDIKVISDEGHGTTFIITMPVTSGDKNG
jgi:signal transduction histidine kinase